jgi:hypothetical protein
MRIIFCVERQNNDDWKRSSSIHTLIMIYDRLTAATRDGVDRHVDRSVRSLEHLQFHIHVELRKFQSLCHQLGRELLEDAFVVFLASFRSRVFLWIN